MTKKEIIEMARKAKLSYGSDLHVLRSVITFAKLIAEKERKECIETIRWKLGRGKRDEYYQAQKDMILLLETKGQE